MKRETYAAARTVSPALHAYFARHRAEAIRRGQEQLAPLPDAETIEAVIDAAFWASLRREEGYEPRISLAFLSREEALHPLILERPLPLSPAALTRVAPAVERPGIHLGVGETPMSLAAGEPLAPIRFCALWVEWPRPACLWVSIIVAREPVMSS